MQVFIKLTVQFASLNCFFQCAIFPLLSFSAFGVIGNAVNFRWQNYYISF